MDGIGRERPAITNRILALLTCDTQIATHDRNKHDKDRDMKGKSGDKLEYTGTNMD